DGIRDFHVTGVQTCALPISLFGNMADDHHRRIGLLGKPLKLCCTFPNLANRTGSTLDIWRGQCLYGIYNHPVGSDIFDLLENSRSEERRVGKECRSRWST